MAADRRTIFLGSALVLAIVVAAVVWTSGGNTTPTGSAPARPPVARNQTAAENGAAINGVGRVNLDALASSRAQPVDAGRNPFRFKPRAPAPPPESTAPAQPKMPVNQTPTTYTPPVPTGPPPPPPIPLKFIGIVTQGNKRIAVLTVDDGKSPPQGGEEGAIILGQYRILKIGNESIEMAYVDGRGRTTMRLTGK